MPLTRRRPIRDGGQAFRFAAGAGRRADFPGDAQAQCRRAGHQGADGAGLPARLIALVVTSSFGAPLLVSWQATPRGRWSSRRSRGGETSFEDLLELDGSRAGARRNAVHCAVRAGVAAVGLPWTVRYLTRWVLESGISLAGRCARHAGVHGVRPDRLWCGDGCRAHAGQAVPLHCGADGRALDLVCTSLVWTQLEVLFLAELWRPLPALLAGVAIGTTMLAGSRPQVAVDRAGCLRAGGGRRSVLPSRGDPGASP